MQGATKVVYVEQSNEVVAAWYVHFFGADRELMQRHETRQAAIDAALNMKLQLTRVFRITGPGPEISEKEIERFYEAKRT